MEEVVDDDGLEDVELEVALCVFVCVVCLVWFGWVRCRFVIARVVGGREGEQFCCRFSSSRSRSTPPPTHLGGGEADGGVVAHDLHADHSHGLALGRVHLACGYVFIRSVAGERWDV